MIGVDRPAIRQAMDFGPPKTVKLCVYLDDGITRQEADELLSGWNSSEAPKYDLYVEPVSYSSLKRKAFFHGGIMDQLLQVPLPNRCDRALWFVNRSVGDVLYGFGPATVLGAPVVLGEVDDLTLTHGFVLAKTASLSQLFESPETVTTHEIYHLLGCGQHFDMPRCYRQIQRLKVEELKLRASNYDARIGEQPFYPTWNNLDETRLLRSRKEVEAAIDRARKGG